MRIILKNTVPIIILVTILLSIYRIIDNSINHKKYHLTDILYLIFIIYFIILINIVTADGLLNYEPLDNIKPFQEILRYQIGSYLFIKNIVGNIVLFIPFGFIFKYLFKLQIRYLLLITILFSLSIELLQLIIGRVFDIDDILLNMIGSILGGGVQTINKKTINQ